MLKNVYGIRIAEKSVAEDLTPGSIAVFSSEESVSPQAVFCLGRKDAEPLLCRFVKKETPADRQTGRNPEPALQRAGRLKSFMTPTPLHIPGSRQSPIADSIHQRMYFIPLNDPENMILVHPEHVLWLHPLMFIFNDEET